MVLQSILKDKAINNYTYVERIHFAIKPVIIDLVDEDFGIETPGAVYSSLFTYLNNKFTDGVLLKEEANKILNIIEITLAEGSLELKEAASLSFLENLSNPNNAKLLNYVKDLIKSKSTEEIDAINRFWNKNKSYY